MLLAGITGGVGSGKSTVTDELARRGAEVVDTDLIAREVVAPGQLGLEAIIARFGRQFLRPDGTLDRRSLGEIVFQDPDALADLNGIVHPLVRDVAHKRVRVFEHTDAIVLLVVPLLVESGHYESDVVIVVDCDEDVAVERLGARGWSEKEARRRMAAQTSREQRRAAADLIIDNSGSFEQLAPQVDGAWQWLVEKREKRRRI